MVENGKKQKERIYSRLLYLLIAIFSILIKMSNNLFTKHGIYISLIIIVLKIMSEYI